MGIPFLIEKFKWIPTEFWQVIKDVLSHVDAATDKKEAIKTVRETLRCSGIGCSPETKGI